MRSLIITFAVCLAGGIAHADIEYVFHLQSSASFEDPSSASLADFSFSFTTPTYLGVGVSSLTFAPFIVGTQTYGWVMTQGLASGNPAGGGCFVFGTAIGVTLSPGEGIDSCIPNQTSGLGVGSIQLYVPFSLPTAPGTYEAGGSADFEGPINTFVEPAVYGNLTVFRAKSLLASDVSAVPEPKSILLLGSILGAVGWRLRRRLA